MNQSAMLGHKIRRLRRDRGLTQVRMAEQLGISPSYLNLIEHNQRAVTVPVLLKLAQVFDVDLHTFAEDDEARIVAELIEVFGDPLLEGREVKEADLRDLANRSPDAGRGVLDVYQAYRRAREDAQALAERLSDGSGVQGIEGAPAPADEVTDFIQEHGNHFPELETAAEELWREAHFDPGDLYRGLVDHLAQTYAIEVEVIPARAGAGAVRRYDPLTRRLTLSEILPASSRNFQLAHQICLLGSTKVLDRLVARAKLSTPESEALCRVALANYFAGGVLMPYEPFVNAGRELRYDLELLQHRFGVSFEQVCHRLTTLHRPGAKGVPFHMVRVDLAGNISKRFSASGIRFARYGGACPLWNVHAAFMTPGTIRAQLSRMPEGATYFSVARTITKAGGGHRVPQSYFAIELGCEVSHARELVYADGLSIDAPEAAVPVGVNCRLCERMDCRQRAFPPLHHHLNVEVNVRGLSAYVSPPRARD